MQSAFLEVRNVSKSYSQHKALDNVSLEVPSGIIYGLLGPNGAGKTTLIRIINQITRPDDGDILINGEPLSQKHIAQIGYLPEERGLYKKMKVGEQLLYLARLKGLNKEEALDKLEYWFEKFEIKSWWDKSVEDLSKGMQQKIQFVATVLHEPKLIILDEPFSGFDPINASIIKDEILELKKKGTTIIFSTHRMESVEELCDSIALIHNSKMVLEGNKEEIKQQFRNNTFNVKFEGNLEGEFKHFEVLSQNHNNFVLKGKSAHNSNDILTELINKGQVISFAENIPTMNDIFISTVNAN